MNVLKKPTLPSRHVPFPRGSGSPSPRGRSCISKTLPRETGGPQVQEVVPTKERKERTLVTFFLKKKPAPPTPETCLQEAVPRDPESPWPFLQKKEKKER
jgi:hypothetical protein